MEQMIPMYNTKTFTNIFENAEEFLDGWKTSGLYNPSLVKDSNINITYFLLYAKYGNNPIANLDINQFKYKVWSIIFQYAPTWEKELDIQAALRALELTGDEIYSGTKMIYNHSYNPSTAPSTDYQDELPTIDDQNTTKYKRGKLDGLSALDELLKRDVTEAYLNRFKKLFKQFVMPEKHYIYVTDEEE